MAAKVVATQPFAVEVKGREVLVHEGDVYASNDPVVKGREHLFEPVAEKKTWPSGGLGGSIQVR